MTILDQAAEVCGKCQMDLEDEIHDHAVNGYVWITPAALALAMRWDKASNTPRFDGDSWWLTLMVGTLAEFIRVDPLPETKWIGYRRARDGSVHWTDYQRLRERVKCGRLKA